MMNRFFCGSYDYLKFLHSTLEYQENLLSNDLFWIFQSKISPERLKKGSMRITQ